jgi:hypothetical protein
MKIDERLNKAKEKISKPGFTEMRSLANEIAFYIFDYDPNDEPVVEKYLPTLIKHFDQEYSDRKIANINLYEILIEKMKKDGILEEIFKLEKDLDDKKLYETLKNYAREEIFVSKIREALNNYDIIFLTGISHIHPIIKSLEELEQAIHEYIDFYNNRRFQKKLGCLAPLEFRSQASICI